jgi:hypothetical protein
MRAITIQGNTKGDHMLRLFILLFLIVSCSSHERTKYQAYKKKNGGGYQEKTLDDGIRVVSFKANSDTKRSLAIKFSKFRAIEICTAENFALTHLLDTFDKTESRNVIRSYSSGYPSYYYGMSPFYNHYSGFGYGFGFSTTNTDAWSETLRYPNIEVVFECANEVYEPQVVFRQVPADEMKHLIKDLKGGLQVEKISNGSSQSKKLEIGDILIRANGERVQEMYQLLNLFQKSQKHKLNIDVLRDGIIEKGIMLTGVNASEKILKAQQEIVRSVCKYEDLKKRALCK